MLKNKKNIITVLDICSSKIVCIIAKITNEGSYEIVGLGYTRAEGIKSGIISDLKLAQNSILHCIAEAEKMCGIKPFKAYVTVSSNYLLSQHIITETSIIGKEITNRDLNKLLLDAIQICKNQQLEIVHSFACNYILDGHHGITNPIGMFGNKLGCKFHILSAPANNLLNLHNCIIKSGLEIESYVSSSYAAGLACLTKDEIETGVMLIDFGAGVTSFAVFENEQMVYVNAIPIGGNHITSDIAKILCISLNEAERIKNLYGGVLVNEIDESELIQLTLNNDDNNCISRIHLIEIISARIDEILQIIQDRIANDGMKIHNFVITGGVARTLGLKEFIFKKLGGKVKISYHKSIMNLMERNNNLEISTALGVLSHVSENIMSNIESEDDKSKKNTTKRFISFLEKMFS